MLIILVHCMYAFGTLHIWLKENLKSPFPQSITFINNFSKWQFAKFSALSKSSECLNPSL